MFLEQLSSPQKKIEPSERNITAHKLGLSVEVIVLYRSDTSTTIPKAGTWTEDDFI